MQDITSHERRLAEQKKRLSKPAKRVLTGSQENARLRALAKRSGRKLIDIIQQLGE